MIVVNIRWLSGPVPSPGWAQPILRHIVNLNLVLLPIAFVLNIIHCKILRLSMQHDAFYTFQMFLCVSHFVYCLASWIPTLLHVLRPDEEYCDRSYSYFDVTVQLITGTTRETSLNFSFWLVLVMSLFSSLGTHWKTFKNSKFAFWMSILILNMAAFSAIVVWTKLRIYTVPIDLACEIAFKEVHDKFMAAVPSETMNSYNLTVQAVNNMKIGTTIYGYPSIIVFLIVVVISLLLRKSLEESSTLLSICTVNLLQTCLFSATRAIEMLMLTTNYNDSLIYAQWFTIVLPDKQDPNFCTGYSSFFNAVFSLMLSFFGTVVDILTYIYVGILGAVTIIISKFPSGAWARSLTKFSFVVEIILSTMVVVSVYNFISSFYSNKIISMTDDAICMGIQNASEINRNEQFKVEYSNYEYPAVKKLLTNMGSATRICFPIIYISLIIVLIKGWTRNNRNPTILVLFFLVSYLLVDVPFLLIEYFLPFFLDIVTTGQYMIVVIIIASIRTWIKLFIASINILIFVVLSSEYRKEFLNVFKWKKKVHLVNAGSVVTE